MQLYCMYTAVHLQAIVRLVVFAILLATAGAVTKLMAMNLESTRSIIWRDHDMEDRIGLTMRVSLSPARHHPCVLGCEYCNATLGSHEQQMSALQDAANGAFSR